MIRPTIATRRALAVLTEGLAKALLQEHDSLFHLGAAVLEVGSEALATYEDLVPEPEAPPCPRKLRQAIQRNINERLARLEDFATDDRDDPQVLAELEPEAARLLQLRALAPFLDGPALYYLLGNTDTKDGREDYMQGARIQPMQPAAPGDDAGAGGDGDAHSDALPEHLQPGQRVWIASTHGVVSIALPTDEAIARVLADRRAQANPPAGPLPLRIVMSLRTGERSAFHFQQARIDIGTSNVNDLVCAAGTGVAVLHGSIFVDDDEVTFRNHPGCLTTHNGTSVVHPIKLAHGDVLELGTTRIEVLFKSRDAGSHDA